MRELNKLLKLVANLIDKALYKLLKVIIDKIIALEALGITKSSDGTIIINGVTIDLSGNVVMSEATIGQTFKTINGEPIFIFNTSEVTSNTVLNVAGTLNGFIRFTDNGTFTVDIVAALNLASLVPVGGIFEFYVDNTQNTGGDVTVVIPADFEEMVEVPNGGLGNLVVPAEKLGGFKIIVTTDGNNPKGVISRIV